ncbi:inovirus Gp2 family protein [Escherichia coli]|uniref:inovirus-type Gp2 protein n=2 Tax=Enterobacterales TaxID=91347 RepID=UPI00128EF6AF|nr:inovirus-type Gp2 protein [Escherichia coli]MQK50414.1 inovirus Gp2 family protein [Escherichia coli]HAP3149438.1 inovirus Gp2 family protein [Escherichia coli]
MSFAIPQLQNLLYQQQTKLFEYYSKILMIRTDFHWREDSERYIYGDEHQFSRDMSILMLRLSKYPGVIGYAWVLEEAPDRGLHAHAVIYVDGQRHRKKWDFNQRMNMLWETITEGEGYLYHCTDNKQYRADISKPIHFDDKRGKRAMRYVVNYLAKYEQKGVKPIYHLSTPPTEKRIGRPRKSSSS